MFFAGRHDLLSIVKPNPLFTIIHQLKNDNVF